MPKQNDWQTISLHPLTGPLDTRSRPADILPGAFRWKQNFSVNPEGKLCRRQGFQRFFADYLYDSAEATEVSESGSVYHNHDFHRRGRTREPITFQFESTASDGTRRFYCGTETGVWLLDQDTGEYTTILSGMGDTNAHWKAAELQDTVVFANNVDPVQSYNPSTGVAQIASLFTINHVSTAAIAIQYNGFMIVMNVIQDGDRQSARILWSDLNEPTDFNQAVADTLAGFQDLEYGDDILSAAPLLGSLYIFTRRSIWRMTVSGDPTSVFAFTKVYNEPKNQTGCIAFPNTLVSTGSDLYYMGRDGIYHYNPYIPFPEREDWLHMADGLMFRQGAYQIDGAYCAAPVGEYRPESRELWFSWPTIGQAGINNWTLVATTAQKTADIVDHGFTSFVNFRRAPATTGECNEVQDLLGASGEDWAIKSIGSVYYREMVTISPDGDQTVDISDPAVYYTVGYNTILRSVIPLGLTDRQKKVRSVLIEHSTSAQDVPCVVALRIGNHYSLVDPNDASQTCTPLWRSMPDLPLKCPQASTNTSMAAQNLKTSDADATSWPVYESGRFLYYEFTIKNADGSAAIGGDTCWARLDFEAIAQLR